MSSPEAIPFLDLRAQQLSIEGELSAVLSAATSRTDWILGEAVERFESEFAAYCGVSHGIGTDSGLSALELLLRAYGVGPGDEVITAANTFIATAFAISHTGARPVLVDCDPDTYNLDPAHVDAAVTSRTRAIIPVHLYGRPAPMTEILEIARAKGLVVIEDACQAHGAVYCNRRAGSLADAAAFSFYPGKNLGAFGDGGMAVTDDTAIRDRVRMLRNYGQSRKYHHELVGFNRRLDSLQAAVLGVKLRHLDDWNAARAEVALAYSAAFADTAVIPPAPLSAAIRSAWHLFVVQTPNRDAVQELLAARGISTGIHYPIPIHLQPAYAGLGYYPGTFPVTEMLADRILSLPLFAELSHDQVTEISAAVIEAVSEVGGEPPLAAVSNLTA